MATGVSTSVTATSTTPRRATRTGFVIWFGRYGTIVGLLLMIVAFSIAAPSAFPTMSNFSNVLSEVSLTAIVATGLTFALVVGEFDLSIGYMASFANVLVVGFLANQGAPIPVAIALALLAGALLGLINGTIITKLGVNALITTLGSGTIVVGLNYAYSGSIPFAVNSRYTPFLGISQGNTFGVPNPILFMGLYLAALWVLLNMTDIGLQMKAIGNNARAARLAGIHVDRVKTLAFIISGFSAAFAGVLLASRIGSAQITAGDGYLLDAFAAAFLGSAVLRLGEPHIVGTLIGVVTIGIGFNGLAIVGVPPFFQFVFKGGLLIVAVAFSSTARRMSRQ